MHITDRELWTLVHGMGFGALYLLAFAGGIAGLYSLRTKLVTVEGILDRVSRLRWGSAVMAVCVWLTVIVGTLFIPGIARSRQKPLTPKPNRPS